MKRPTDTIEVFRRFGWSWRTLAEIVIFGELVRVVEVEDPSGVVFRTVAGYDCDLESAPPPTLRADEHPMIGSLVAHRVRGAVGVFDSVSGGSR